MKHFCMILLSFFVMNSLWAQENKAVKAKDANTEEAILAIEGFMESAKNTDPNYKKIESRLVHLVPIMKKKYGEERWFERFQFMYFSLTEMDQAQNARMAPAIKQYPAIDPSALLKLYLADEREKAGAVEKMSIEQKALAVKKRLIAIEYDRDIEKMSLPESMGREYAVIATYYPESESFLSFMRDRVRLLSEFNIGRITRGQFEFILYDLQRRFSLSPKGDMS